MNNIYKSIPQGHLNDSTVLSSTCKYQHSMRASVHVLTALLHNQLVAWENRGQPQVLGPCLQKRDPERAPGFWLQTGSAPAIATISRMNQ